MLFCFSLRDETTVEGLLERATGATHLKFVPGSAIGDNWKLRKSEIMGGLTKARLAMGQSAYVSADQYDKLNADPETKRKFLANRKFMNALVDTYNSVNLLKPHEVLCHLCGKKLVLQSLGSLSDYRKHLLRHKADSSEKTSGAACALLARWAELEAGATEDMSAVPVDLIIKKNMMR